MANYITTKISQLYNNSGAKMEVWPVNHPFTTGEWVKDNRLYLGPTLANRWIEVGDYKEVEVTPPPDDPPPPVNLPVGTIQQTRYSIDNGVTWTPWEYWTKTDV
jgi:hypothetical protein